MKLGFQTAVASVFGLVFFGLALFLPAGTFNYWQAWVFIAVYTVATAVPNMYLAVRNPAALQRRLRGGPTAETRPIQKIAVSGTVLAVVVMLVVSALDHRFGWSEVPLAVNVAGNVLVAVGLGVIATILEPKHRRLVPSPTAVGIGMLVPAIAVAPMVLGGIG